MYFTTNMRKYGIVFSSVMNIMLSEVEEPHAQCIFMLKLLEKVNNLLMTPIVEQHQIYLLLLHNYPLYYMYRVFFV